MIIVMNKSIFMCMYSDSKKWIWGPHPLELAITQWWWQASAGFNYSVWTPMVFHITPKLERERRSGMVGLGTSVIFVAGLQLLGAG